MTTNVPAIAFTAAGAVAPSESAILAGVNLDINGAFGGGLNMAPTTPQGQLATAITGYVGDGNNNLLAVFNGVDPAFATGRMQDAIGRIYFIERNPAQSTVVVGTCSGKTGVTIPVGAKAADQAGNIFVCTQAGVIPVGGSIALSFACIKTGAIACPIGHLSAVYQAIPGWDSITNAAAGVVGNDVESAADFEFRRSASVALNAHGSLPAIRGAALTVGGVLDAYSTENCSGATSGAAVTASIAAGVMTVSAVSDGTISLGDLVVGAGVVAGTIVLTFGTGAGGVGTYNISIPQTVGSDAMTSSPGGVRLPAHSLYVAAFGGAAQDIGNAIWTKKDPGCNWVGNTAVTVYDTDGYSAPYPTYTVLYQVPAAVAITVAVTIRGGVSVPANAAALIQAAVLAAFSGADGGQRARIGQPTFAARFYGPIFALGSWVLVYSVKVGVGTANQDVVQLPIDKIMTLAATDITVTQV